MHVDMDAFFVSVELRRRPELRGKPVVVGGTGNRGVVAAASYEARRFGVHSAMPSAIARLRCPEAVFLPGDHELYGRVSAEVFDVFRCFTPAVEGISLDEAFLDLTGAIRLLGPAVEIGAAIRRRIDDELALGCSAGIAPNKFLAKLGSEAAKPRASPAGVRPGRGIVEIRPGGELAFLHPLAVQALWGVGPATLTKLERLGVSTVGDLAALGEQVLIGALGAAHGGHLFRLSHGIDDRPVEVDRAAKSIGHEETYPHDLFDPEVLRAQVVRLADGVAARLRHHGVGARTVTLKVRFAGFTTVTRSVTVREPVTAGPALVRLVLPLLEAIDPTPGVRLLGISGSNLAEPHEQLTLGQIDGEHDVDAAWNRASVAIDGIRDRFGTSSIGPGSAMREGRLKPVRTGAQQWGPDAGEPGNDPKN